MTKTFSTLPHELGLDKACFNGPTAAQQHVESFVVAVCAAVRSHGLWDDLDLPLVEDERALMNWPP